MNGLTISEGMHVEILVGSGNGQRGTVKRLNAARTRAYVLVGSKLTGFRIVRVHVHNVMRDSFWG